ncbi:hypothetical protein EVAR_56656_1 [Eumeta japonica]|uniref:Uncharacterized protein n=1 Tax=Eumeta variegata TaxID=151549 RepID=A0A4C1YRE8_EUMVA|nr:hypothetical protein EVAR_56656_1 [Eumeta japonica]
MRYVSSVFAPAYPDALYDLQIIQNRFCKSAADAPCPCESDTSVCPGTLIAHNEFSPPSRPAHGRTTKKNCIRCSRIPTATYEARAAINKSERCPSFCPHTAGIRTPRRL